MMRENVLFRKATPHDAESIKEIAKGVIRHNYVSFLGAEATEGFISSGLSDQEIDDGLERCIVMLFNDTIIGFAITHNDLLHLIMVDVPFQGRGHGGKLLKYAEGELFSRYETIRLQTFQENTDAAKFYRKNGWKITEEQDVPELGLAMCCLKKAR